MRGLSLTMNEEKRSQKKVFIYQEGTGISRLIKKYLIQSIHCGGSFFTKHQFTRLHLVGLFGLLINIVGGVQYEVKRTISFFLFKISVLRLF